MEVAISEEIADKLVEQLKEAGYRAQACSLQVLLTNQFDFYAINIHQMECHKKVRALLSIRSAVTYNKLTIYYNISR